MSITTRGDRLGSFILRLGSVDTSLCALLNTCSRSVSLRVLFRSASRLGDGVIWYAMMIIMPLIAGRDGVQMAVHMGVTALAGLWIYRLFKHHLGRERPYIQHAEKIVCAMPPLDRYSFPSGHTLHAVSFTVIARRYLPELAWVLVPFAILVALSRMVLGLHYPSDVLAGACLGSGLAALSLELVTPPG